MIERCGARLTRATKLLVASFGMILLFVLSCAVRAEGVHQVRVGVYENPPKIFTDGDGVPTGILVELLREIAKGENWQLVFVRCEWNACLEQTEDGRIDLMPDVAYTEERARRFDFHRTAVLHSWSQIYRRGDVVIESLFDLKDKRIAMLAGGVQQQAVQGMLGGFGIQAEIIPTNSQDKAFELVAAGGADVAITNYQFGGFKAADFRLVATPVVFLPVRLFYATGRGRNAPLLTRIDEYMERWQREAASPYYQVIRRWGSQAPSPLLPPAVRNGLVALAALGLVLFGSVVVLRRQVRVKTSELRRVNDQLEAILDAMPDILFEFDLEGRYLGVRTTRAEHLAAPPEHILGRTIGEVLPAEAAAVCLDALREANEAGWSGGKQISLMLPQGQRWFELSVARKNSDAPGPPRFIMLSRDISTRRQAQVGLQRVATLYATLSRCNEAIVRSTDQGQLLQQICQDAVSYGGMKMVWIGLLDQGDGLVKPVAASGQGTEYLEGIRISIDGDDLLGRGPTGTAIRENQPVWCQDYANDPMTAPWRDRGRRFGWAASAALPLHREGVAVGALCLYAGEVNAFDAAARDLLVRMAMDIDFALDRFAKDAERARMAQAIVESEKKYRELTESISDVIWILDPETLRFLYVSPSVQRLRGYTPEEIIAQPMDAALTPDSAIQVHQRLAARMAEFLAGRLSTDDVQVDEVEQPCKDGSTVWTEVVTNLVMNRATGKVEVHGVTRDISERKRAEAQIQRLAHFDHLTGLPNRTLLKDHFNYALSLAQRNLHPLATMFLDLDHFKNINDNLGHDVGDQLLIEVAHRLKSSLRAGDTVSRLGGDEFIFVLPDTDADGAMRVATKLLGVIAQPYVIGQYQLRTTASIGIAMYPEDGGDIDTLSRNADAAMYQVKRDGRNDFRFFTQEMQARSARALTLANALHHALDLEQLSLVFQPQVSLRDGRVVGAEALLRWQHPELGAVLPAEFIPIAESNGLIVQIGEWVLRHAVAQARCWMDRGLPPLIMAVNLSAAQFRHPNLPELVTRIVDEIGFPAEQLELELTEAVAMNDPQSVVDAVDRLFERGVRMSIDDFGTGYSSLSYLKRFKIIKLKIDRSFVRDITEDPEDKAIVTAIINLAHSLGMFTVAEGVESAGQLDFLRQQGCDEVQGYYFSRPLAAAQFEAFVQGGQARINQA